MNHYSSVLSTLRDDAQSGQEISTKKSNTVSLTTTTTTKARLCTPCPYPTTYIPVPSQYSRAQYEELALHFENRVKEQWKRVWFGLYQVQEQCGGGGVTQHAKRIRMLYAGAGMADILRQPGFQDTTVFFRGLWEFVGLGKLSEALVESGPTDSWPVIGRIKVYDGIALDNMQYISVLLRQYEEQIDKVANLYEFLEQMQLPTPCSGGGRSPPTEEHRRAVLYGFRERADTISQSLLDLDAEMAALQRSIDKETEMLHGRLDGVEFLHFRKDFLHQQ